MHDLSPAPGPTENAIRWSFPPRVCLARVIISTNLNYAPGRSIISEASDGKRKKRRTKKLRQNVARGAKIKKGVDQQIRPVVQQRNFCGKIANVLFVFMLAKYFEMVGNIAKSATVKHKRH